MSFQTDAQGLEWRERAIDRGLLRLRYLSVGAELKLTFRRAATVTANSSSGPVSKVAEDVTPYRATRKT